ncbi:hypothetical protein Q095_04327 [Pseudomonas aeruginosa PS50]|nr:hypothetical protein Q095_04327 [Pseudomonas aeruginosa PS50]
MPIHNLNHVNMFLQVIASGSISSAARILRKSHTAVSSAVSNLEIDLCVELVRRDGYKVEPTEQALRLIPYMRSLLNYQQLIGDIAFNLNKGPRNLRVLAVVLRYGEQRTARRLQHGQPDTHLARR